MSLINMKDEVINKFGKDSFEAGYIQHCFSYRGTDFFIEVYDRMMKKEANK